MLVTIDEAVDTFLMQIESLILVRQFIDVVNVDQPVQGARKDVVQIGIELNLSDPAFMCVLPLMVDALNTLLPLERLHFLCNFNFSSLSGISLNIVIIVIVSFLVPCSLLLFSDRLVTGLSRCLFGLKCGIKTLLVIVINFLIAAVISDNLASFVLFELLRIEVTIVPVGLSEVILCDNAEIVAHEQSFELLPARLFLILALILNNDFIVDEAYGGPPMVLQT